MKNASLIITKKIQLDDQEVLEIPQYCFNELLQTTSTKMFHDKVKNVFCTETIITKYENYAFQLLCQWCFFFDRFEQFSEQIVRFKQSFIEPGLRQELLLQLLQLSDLFGVRTLEQFLSEEIAARLEGMSVQELRQLLQVNEQYQDIALSKFIQEVYIDELSNDFSDDQSI